MGKAVLFSDEEKTSKTTLVLTEHVRNPVGAKGKMVNVFVRVFFAEKFRIISNRVQAGHYTKVTMSYVSNKIKKGTVSYPCAFE